MAYGHCGDLDHGGARRLLLKEDEWRTASSQVAEAYERYRATTGNALFWAGWNFWDPREPEDLSRRLQVVLSEDLAITDSDITDPSRPLLNCNGVPILTVADFLEPDPEAPIDQVKLNSSWSNDVEFVPSHLRPARLFLHNLWKRVFVPSVHAFRRMGEDSIVDYLRNEHKRYVKEDLKGLPCDFAGILGQDPVHALSSRLLADVRLFTCNNASLDAVWDAVVDHISRLQRNTANSPLLQSKADLLLESWERLANSDSLNSLASQLDDIANTIRSPLSRRQAYVFLQHLALFERFLLSPNQYVFSVPFGRHVFIAYLAMKGPLCQEQLAGWRHIVSALFGSLLVEQISQQNAELQVSEDRYRQAAEQSVMLSHSLPKSVFKPAEYFVIKMHSQVRRLSTEASEQCELIKTNLARMAETTLLLLQKGQAELGDYAKGVNPAGKDLLSVNLLEICQEVADISDLSTRP